MISAPLTWLGQTSGPVVATLVALAATFQEGRATETASSGPLELRGAQEGDFFGVAVAAVDDVDGDGVRDLLVGANNYTTNVTLLGLLARPKRMDLIPYAVLHSGKDRRELLRITAVADAKESNFGLGIVGAADADGDGRPDLAFGLPHLDLGESIRVEVGGLPEPSIELRSSRDGRRLWCAVSAGPLSGFSLARMDDVDGDGCGDIAVGGPASDKTPPEVKLHSGRTGQQVGALKSPSNECEHDQEFGNAIARVSDLDGDGVRDVAVGDPGLCRDNQRSLGAVHAYSAKKGTLLRTWTGQREGQHYGCAVAGLGDLDHDGTEEIAVGARGEQDRGPFSGAAYVLSPKREQPLYRFEGQEGSEFGSRLGSAGDFNGDGVDDIWVGAVRDLDDSEKCGLTVIYSGKDGAELARGRGGVAAALGDVNGDGCDDLAVGCPTEQKGRGVVRILLGHR